MVNIMRGGIIMSKYIPFPMFYDDVPIYYLKKFTSLEELVSAIENYIHFYNTRRYQKRLNYMTPCEYYFATAA